MILIISNKGDIHCNPVIKHLQNSNAPYFRLNTEELITDYRISFLKDCENRSYLQLSNLKNNKTLHSNKITAVWDRRPITQKAMNNDKKIEKIINDEIKELNLWIRYFFHGTKMIGSSVFDRPNESKIRQIDVVEEIISSEELDIKIPKTILTNDIDSLNHFIKTKNYIVIKPIGADAYQVDDIYEIPFISLKKSASDLRTQVSQQDLDLCPVFCQEYIEKKFELRVTSIGSKHYTCMIDSQKLPSGKGKEDWREGYQHGLKELQTVIDTPPIIEQFCNSYLKNINSNFGCFDFIIDTNDDYYFLECNPNGQWMWIEEDTGMPISKAIADFLSS